MNSKRGWWLIVAVTAATSLAGATTADERPPQAVAAPRAQEPVEAKVAPGPTAPRKDVLEQALGVLKGDCRPAADGSPAK